MTHVTIVSSPAGALDGSQLAPAGLPELTLNWPDESACANMASQLALALRSQMGSSGSSGASGSAYIELHGTLGAGKTTFTRHLLRALGVQGRIKSPSYAVVEPHELPGLAIHHFDFYRFNDPQEWEDAGFRDLFAAPGLKLAEWPEKAAGLLPVPDLHILIEVAPSSDQRAVRLRACTPLGEAALLALSSLDASGAPGHE